MKRANLIILSLLSAVGCTTRQPAREVDPVRVETIVASVSAAASEKSYVGVVEEQQSAALSFPLGGTVVRIRCDEGQSVAQGDLLAELDDASARRSYDAAKAAYEQALDARARLKRLYDEKSLPEIQWVEVQTKLRQAESAFGIAEKNLHDCELHAPFAGVVGKRLATVGETAVPGMPVLTLLEIGSVKVRFAVPEREIGRLRADDRIEVSVAALDDETFVATAMEKGVAADAVAHTYDVRATIANPSGDLLPGMVCRVALRAAGAGERILLPVRAVQQSGDGRRFVWRVCGDSVARVSVETGALFGNDIVITAGIAAGDRIVTGGMQKIGEGSKVCWR